LDVTVADVVCPLLEATIHSLAEGGFAVTTSRRVCELAGVSMGAQTYHFPHRTDLLGAAVEYLADRRLAEMRELAADLPTDSGERLAALLDLLWADFNSPTFVVFVKLYVAAADDPDLYARLVPIERQLSDAIVAHAIEILGDQVVPDFGRRLLLVLSAVRGLALTEHFEPRGRRRRDPWPSLRATLLESLLPALEAAR